MPYDRPNTAMSVFRFVRCVSMNTVTADRRFHAQPNACPDCGPHIWLTDPQQQITARFDDALSAAVRLLKDGKILAMQGLGGFHGGGCTKQ